MSRYIDADALRKAFYKDRVSVCSHVFSLVNPLDSEDLEFEIYNMIDAAPTVDAVPVVRCKDCERWTNPIPIEMKEEGDGYCGVLWTNTHEDEYCAWGKRRFVE